MNAIHEQILRHNAIIYETVTNELEKTWRMYKSFKGRFVTKTGGEKNPWRMSWLPYGQSLRDKRNIWNCQVFMSVTWKVLNFKRWPLQQWNIYKMHYRIPMFQHLTFPCGMGIMTKPQKAPKSTERHRKAPNQYIKYHTWIGIFHSLYCMFILG